MTDQQDRVPWAQSGLDPLAVCSIERGAVAESLVIARRSTGDADVARLGSSHPADWLAGSLAAIDCTGLSLLAPGVVLGSHWPRGVTDTDGARPGHRVIVAYEVQTDGSDRLWVGGHDGLTSRARSGGRGLVPDAMRRALQLETPPPDEPVGWFWLAAWLADVIAADSGRGAREVAGLHPGIDSHELDHVPDSTLSEFVVNRHVDHGRAVDWTALRCAATSGTLELGHVPAGLAAWHDDGSFSRLLADQLPSMVELCEAAGALLTPPAHRLIASVASAVARHG